MYIDFLLEVFRAHQAQEAVIWQEQRYSYAWMVQRIEVCLRQLNEAAVPSGAVVSLEADFSPNAVAFLLALIERGCIIVPLTTTVEAKKPEFREVSQVEITLEIDKDDNARIQETSTCATHELFCQLREKKRPGLVLFSSGSTGKSKAAVHDFVPLLAKFEVRRHAFRTLTFLLFDHIGGVNTLLYTLSNGGCAITAQDRSPDAICEAIESYQVQLLPTSPTFINLLLVSEAYKRHDLSSLHTVTYGTEVMPESTLRKFHQLFPNVRLLQTYGLSEVGILRSKSKSSDSLWVQVGGEGFETRVVHGLLEIKAQSAMLGYLNAPSPFTDDGWFQTGDAVEVDGPYLRILGRKSEVINVGGEKVYPAEVEGVLQLMEGVQDVMVSAVRSPLTGQMVQAKVNLRPGESVAAFRKRMRQFCQGRLLKHQIPQKVVLVTDEMHGQRFKKMRGPEQGGGS